jgi:hypothetical protein
MRKNVGPEFECLWAVVILIIYSRGGLVERESCNTKCCKIRINVSKIYFQTKIHTIIAGGTK